VAGGLDPVNGMILEEIITWIDPNRTNITDGIFESFEEYDIVLDRTMAYLLSLAEDTIKNTQLDVGAADEPPVGFT
jgi:hypothetical protein